TAIHYSSGQSLDHFQRRLVNDSNNFIATIPVGLSLGGGKTLNKNTDKTIQFVTPYALNTQNPLRMLIGTSSLYESSDRGDTLKKVANNIGPVRAIAYGGRVADVPTPEAEAVAYVATGAFGDQPARLWLRSKIDGPFEKLTAYPGGVIKDIVMK